MNYNWNMTDFGLQTQAEGTLVSSCRRRTTFAPRQLRIGSVSNRLPNSLNLFLTLLDLMKLDCLWALLLEEQRQFSRCEEVFGIAGYVQGNIGLVC